MAFRLYQIARLGDGHLTYQQLNTVTLAGGGLIYESCKKSLTTNDVGWTITNEDLLSAGGYDAAQYALVIDIARIAKERSIC